MKLTTLKVSVPVLMMMLFQSGYGVSDWFARACVAAINEGNTLEAQRIMVENNPSSVTMTDEANKDFENELKTLIKESIDGFVPRGFENDGPRELFKTEAMNDILGLQDVTVDTVKNSFTNTIVRGFWTVLDSDAAKYLLRNDAVKNNVEGLTTTWAKTDVPQALTARYDALVGTNGETTGENTIWKFIRGVSEYDETTGPVALGKLLDHDYFESMTPLAGAFDWSTLKDAVNAVAGEDQKVDAVVNALTERATVIRTGSIPGEGSPVVWDNEAYLSWQFNQVAEGTVAEKAEGMRVQLYNDCVDDLFNHEFEDTDLMAYYLNLFGFWKIGGNAPDNPEKEETFLRYAIEKMDTAADAAAKAAGEETVADWVEDADAEVKRKVLEDAIYSTFGTTYEDLLRHSDTPSSSDLSGLVKAVNEASTPEEKAEAVKGSIETLDGDASNTVAQAVKDIKAVS